MNPLRRSKKTAHNQPNPLPLYLTNTLFFTMFFSVMYFLLLRWREKIRNSVPLHVITLPEVAAIASLVASFIYLLGFFGIDFVQSIFPPSHYPWEEIEDTSLDIFPILVPSVDNTTKATPLSAKKNIKVSLLADDEEIVKMLVRGSIPSYSLESNLKDCNRAAILRRAATERITGKSLSGLPVEGFDFGSILGQCCEMPVGYVQIPVGIAGPLLLNGAEYSVPMATTEGCLVASTNRGCKAIYVSGGATCLVLKDGMTRAPVVRFDSVKRAAELKQFLEDPLNFEMLAVVFNK